jgi:putative ABC transport system permease protein
VILRVALALIRAASFVAPAADREEFVDEWTAEVRCRLGGPTRPGASDARAQLGTLGMATGAIADAIALRTQGVRMDTLLQDLRYAARTMIRRRGFTALIVATLALGLGANTAVFSVIDSILLRPLPYADPGTLVIVWENDRLNRRERYPVAPANYLDWRDEQRSFSAIGAWMSSSMDLTGAGEPVRIPGLVTTASVFEALGVRPAMGRTLTAGDEREGMHRVAVISHGAWERRFGSDPRIIGRSIQLSGAAYEIVGVMPRGFVLPDREAELWRPLVMNPQTARLRAVHFLTVVARLAPGASLERARSEMNAIAKRQQERHPDTNAQRDVTINPMHDEVVGTIDRPLYVLGAAVALILLIGCANVANLLLARASAREREMAVRAALGAPRARLVRQLLTEGLLMSAAAGGIGVLVAVWTTRALVRLEPAGVPRIEQVGVDLRTLAFAGVVSMLTGVVFALAPARRLSRPDVHAKLEDGSRGAGHEYGGRRLRSVLLVGEVAMALVLVIAAGLMLRSFARVSRVNPGFDARHVLTASVTLPMLRYGEDRLTLDFYDRLLDRLRALPGVRAVGAASALPMTGGGATTWVTIEGRPRVGTEPPEVGLRAATPDYFRALGIRTIGGRGILPTDSADGERVIVVNDALVRRFWPGENPVGRRVRIGPNPKAPWRTIVGVVEDVRHESLDQQPTPELYLPFTQESSQRAWVVVKTGGDPLSLAGALRAQLAALDPLLPLSSIATMEQVVGASVSRRRFTMTLLGAFAGIALILALIGIYGVMGYLVSQRTHEIGVRMALGAAPGDVRQLVLGQGLALAATGVAIGIAGALLTTRLMSALLYDLEPTDAATFVTVSLAVLAVSLLACYLPARRASNVDPIAALRVNSF